MAAVTVASSQPLRFHSEIPPDDINPHTAPPEKLRASQHHAITASKANVSNTPKKRRIKKGRVPRFPPIDDPVRYLGWLCEDPEAFDEYEDIHENESNSQDAEGSNQANPIFIEDNTADLDLEPEAEGEGAGNTGNKADKVGDQLVPHELGDGNDRSDEDDEDEELPSLEELEDLLGASSYYHLKPTGEEYLQVNQQAVSTPRPASPSLQEPTFLHRIELPHDEASNHIHNKEDGNSDGVADNQSDVSSPEPAVKRRTRAKKDKFNKMNLDDEDDEDNEEDFYGDRNDSQVSRGSSQANPIIVEDDTADLDSETEGDEAGKADDEADEADDRPTPRGLDGGNNGSDKDDEDDEELPSLEALEEEIRAPAHNRTTPSTLDGNQTDNSAEGRRIGTAPQFGQELRTSVAASQESSGAEKSKKRRSDQLDQPDSIDYISDTSVSESGGSVRPRKQRRSLASQRTTPSGSPTLGLNDGDGIKKRAVSAARPTSSSSQHCMSPRDTRPPEDGANDSRNHIPDDLVNGLAEESDNEDGENVMDEGGAENYSDGSGDSDDTDDDNPGDGDSDDTDDDNSGDGGSSDSDEGNEARGCVGRRGLPTPITSQSKTKRAAKHHLQRSHHSPSISSTHASDQSTALTSNYHKRVASPIHNRLRTRKPLLSPTSGSDSNKAIPGVALNANSEEILIRAAFRRQKDGSYALDILPQRFPLPFNLVKQAQEPKPQEPKSRIKFTEEEDALLIKLKERYNLSWEQIKDRFPKRTLGSLQAHYCSKLKVRPAVQKKRGWPAGQKRRQ